jgi:hypothetical protein
MSLKIHDFRRVMIIKSATEFKLEECKMKFKTLKIWHIALGQKSCHVNGKFQNSQQTAPCVKCISYFLWALNTKTRHLHFHMNMNMYTYAFPFHDKTFGQLKIVISTLKTKQFEPPQNIRIWTNENNERVL